MFRLIKMELKRLMYSKAFYATLIGFLIIIQLGISGIGEVKEQGTVDAYTILDQFCSGYMFMVFILTIFVSAYIHLDFHCGQIKNIVSSTKDKGSFINIKFQTMGFLFFIAYVFSLAALYCYATITGTVMIASKDILEIILTFLEVYLIYMALQAFYLLFAVCFKKEMFCISLGVVLCIGYPIGLQLIGNKIGIELGKYSLIANALGLDVKAPIETKLIFSAIAIVYIIVLTEIGKVYLRKTDIHV